jgi:glycosyltransferase involved in cell wall biosynthesis
LKGVAPEGDIGRHVRVAPQQASRMTSSHTQLIIIPSYNPGPRLLQTVREALAVWQPVWVVDDGSDDGSLAGVQDLARSEPGLRILCRAVNGGKGAAVLEAAQIALAEGFEAALVMDADGQHPAGHVQAFMEESRRLPGGMIVGQPVFGAEAPLLRLYGRKLSVWMVCLELGGARVRDPLFGFRVYPLRPLVAVMRGTRFGRRYDFDPEFAVRLVWAGVPALNVPAPCRYISAEAGGISHFHYLRDNFRMIFLHTRLISELLFVRWWRRTPAFLLGLLLGLGLPLASAAELQQAGPEIDNLQGLVEWTPLLSRLASQGAVMSTFSEQRWFPFKKTPARLQGEMRYSPELGLSLRYTQPEERMMILDATGLLMRDGKGRQRNAPSDPKNPDFAHSLLSILRFDEATLRQNFSIHGIRDGQDWRLDLIPRDKEQLRSLGVVTVWGAGELVRRMEFRRAANQRIEVSIQNSSTVAGFSEAERRRFFR